MFVDIQICAENTMKLPPHQTTSKLSFSKGLHNFRPELYLAVGGSGFGLHGSPEKINVVKG